MSEMGERLGRGKRLQAVLLSVIAEAGVIA